MVRYLAALAPPRDAEGILERYICRLGWPYSEWQSQGALEALVEVGARWEHATPDTVGYVRRVLLGLSDSTFVDVMKLFGKGDWCAPEILKELGRTPAMKNRMRAVGFLPSDEEGRHYRYRPTRTREVIKKFGVEPSKKKKVEPPLRRVVHLGSWSPGGREVRLSRQELFERVWSTPVMTLAEEWGMSGRGLGKACKRLNVPVPPRGYWAKVHAGHRVRRPKLPRLAEGEGEVVVIRVPAPEAGGAGTPPD